MSVKEKQNPQETMLVLTVGFLLISLISGKKWPAEIAVAVGLAGILSDYLSGLITKGWYGLAAVLETIVPKIWLTLIFYFFLFPLALLSRIFSRKDNLHLKQPALTNYTELNRTYEKKMFENPW